MGKYFGTDGLRGEANKNLTAEHAYKIGRFLGWYYGRNKEEGEKCKIVIEKTPAFPLICLSMRWFQA